MADNTPLRFTHVEASALVAELDAAVKRIAGDLRRRGFDSRIIEMEMALALGRQCLRHGLDFFPPAAADHIDRLEVALADAGAVVSRAHIATGSVDGEIPQPMRATIRGMDAFETAVSTRAVSRIITEPGWLPRIEEYFAGLGYHVTALDHTGHALIVDVVRIEESKR